MYKKMICILLFCFLIIGAVSAADFKINEGFNEVTEYYSVNEENGMTLCTWEYDDEDVQESYFQNSTDYKIVPGDNNIYNTTYMSYGTLNATLAYVSGGNVTLDHGCLEIVKVDGVKYVIYAHIEGESEADWQLCHDELMKFNENNNLKPLADAI